MNTVVVMPTYNEALGIEAVLDAVLASAPDADILVVDDSSPDGTGQIVQSHPAYGRRIFLLSRITFTDRAVGESKMSGAIVREAVVRVLAWRWHELRDSHRAPVLIGRPHGA